MPPPGVNQGYSTRLPVDQIKTMRAQGMDNNVIIQALQRDGYSSTDIFDAMNQADMISGDPSAQMPQFQQPPQYQDSFSSQSMQDSGFISQRQTSSIPREFGSDASTEELVEAIIDEKWNELVKDLGKVIEWKNSMNSRIIQIEQKFEDLRLEFDKLHTALISKIEDYDKNITNVGAEVRAMEKVFSKVLPVFTENVSELSRITRDIKKGSSGSGANYTSSKKQ